MSLDQVTTQLDGSTIVLEYDWISECSDGPDAEYAPQLEGVLLKTSDGLVDMTEWISPNVALWTQLDEQLPFLIRKAQNDAIQADADNESWMHEVAA